MLFYHNYPQVNEVRKSNHMVGCSMHVFVMTTILNVNVVQNTAQCHCLSPFVLKIVMHKD